jgi:hypothetical protein
MTENQFAHLLLLRLKITFRLISDRTFHARDGQVAAMTKILREKLGAQVAVKLLERSA